MSHRPELSCALALALSLAACGGRVGEMGEAPGQGPQDGVRVGSWQAVNAGLPAGAEVRSAAYLDGAVFVVAKAVDGCRVFALPDGEQAWIPADPPARGGEAPVALAVLERTVYLTAADEAAGTGSLYRLRFFDDPWKRLDGAPDLPLSALARKEGHLIVAASGAGPEAGLYASADEVFFDQVVSATRAAVFHAPIRAIAAAPAARRMFLTGDPASGFGGLYASDDGGRNWSPSPVSGEVSDIRAAGPWVLLATTEAGALRSDNYGSTFAPLDVQARPLSFHLSEVRAFLGTASGVLVSSDAGETWKDASAGLPASLEVRAVYQGGGALLAASAQGVFLARVE